MAEHQFSKLSTRVRFSLSAPTKRKEAMMTDQHDLILAHALRVPLMERLRGQSWIPGIPYQSQAATWMAEAAILIEELEQKLKETYGIE